MSKRIALEIGHGWRIRYSGTERKKVFDPGAQGPGGTYEHEEAKNIAREAAKLLRAKGHVVDMIFTPCTLQQRGRLAGGYDIFVSTHLNAFDQQVQGTEALVKSDARVSDIELANRLLISLATELGFRNRGILKKDLAVLRSVPQSVRASCLIEPFFIDSVATVEDLKDFVCKAGRGLAMGIHATTKQI